MGYDTASIRELNDRFRRNLDTGIVVVTPGVAALGKDAVQTIFRTIRAYDDFTHDPHREHDAGFLSLSGQRIFWKIDYYDLALNMHSPDPNDPEVTQRVITVMLATEY